LTSLVFLSPDPLLACLSVTDDAHKYRSDNRVKQKRTKNVLKVKCVNEQHLTYLKRQTRNDLLEKQNVHNFHTSIVK